MPPGRCQDNLIQKHNPPLSSSSFNVTGVTRWCPTILSSQSMNILARYVTVQKSHGLCSTGSTLSSSDFSSLCLTLSGLNHIMYHSCSMSWCTLQLDTPRAQPYSNCETYIFTTLTLKMVSAIRNETLEQLQHMKWLHWKVEITQEFYVTCLKYCSIMRPTNATYIIWSKVSGHLLNTVIRLSLTHFPVMDINSGWATPFGFMTAWTLPGRLPTRYLNVFGGMAAHSSSRAVARAVSHVGRWGLEQSWCSMGCRSGLWAGKFISGTLLSRNHSLP
jgi:hypothetical protein